MDHVTQSIRRLIVLAVVLGAVGPACATQPGGGGDGRPRDAAREAAPAAPPGGESPAPSDAAVRNHDPRCLSHRGCPRAEPLPPCSLDVVPMSVAEVLAADPSHLTGHTISVAGSLAVGEGSCTLLLCEGRCCNRCHGPLAIRDQASGRALMMVSNDVPELECSGDESRLCCPPEVGRPVAAVGQLFKAGMSIDGPIWWLAVDHLCTMP